MIANMRGQWVIITPNMARTLAFCIFCIACYKKMGPNELKNLTPPGRSNNYVYL